MHQYYNYNKIFGYFSDCQLIIFENQLINGIQVFDIRLRLKNNTFKIYHGPIYYNNNLFKMNSKTYLVNFSKETSS